ncbi:L,D-transpeptidase [Mycolicibacterium brumae]|uniref:L,D-TPase catalytic domain-containing protein n=1 Tax=Mycolicibacterium brumae TaxID=85968 RepID=A0A2G5PGY0_9MYCO|nr:L,D-transpeptidase [Mycolicibacterium brumae]PIB77569.1 hypothetical protein CQY22_001045 [Mycolicibacterium brumae]RWA18598.1 hypothetical protein MBRU_05090 [Mycolicibacterium brumae DSM 44177]
MELAVLRVNRRLVGAWLAAFLGVLVIAGGVLVTWLPECQGRCADVANASHPVAVVVTPGPAKLAVMPADGSKGVSPAAPVRVAARTGTLKNVSMVNDAGVEVPGTLSADRLSWTPDTQLGYGRGYTLTTTAVGPGETPTKKVSSFRTVSPDAQSYLYLRMSSGNLISEGATYGVGAVISARFDSPVANRAAAEARMKVTSVPAVEGSWNWVNDQTAHWRPRDYYPAGARVTVDAPMYGVPLGDGVYGAQDEKVSFLIGPRRVSIVDDVDKIVHSFENHQLVRSMPTSMGKGGVEQIAGQTLTYWTPPGIYSVFDKAESVVMDSSTYGVPVNSWLGYKLTIPWATRISTNGIYLHQLNDTVWAQGNTNVSHGCLNLSGENAQWFYNFAQPGDIVEVKNTGGPALTLEQGGDWSVPWDQWQAGSAFAVAAG